MHALYVKQMHVIERQVDHGDWGSFKPRNFLSAVLVVQIQSIL